VSFPNDESTRQTPAGLPLNGVSVKESTVKVFILCSSICSFAISIEQDDPILHHNDEGSIDIFEKLHNDCF